MTEYLVLVQYESLAVMPANKYNKEDNYAIFVNEGTH